LVRSAAHTLLDSRWAVCNTKRCKDGSNVRYQYPVGYVTIVNDAANPVDDNNIFLFSCKRTSSSQSRLKIFQVQEARD
jgi:hypothetical protein